MDDSIPQTSLLRQCDHCYQIFPATAEYFHRNRSKKSGWSGTCKECAHKAWAIKHPPREPAPPPGYQRCTGCKELFPATLEYFHASSTIKSGLVSKCKTCRQTLYYWQCREEVLAKQHDAYAAHPDKRLTYYHEHKESYHAKSRQYREENRERIYARNRNRYARKKSIPGTHTPSQIRDQYERQKGRCYYCRQKIKFGEHHVDHTFPVSRANGIDPINSIDYLVMSCASCNIKKNDRYPWEFPEGGRLL